MTLPVPQPDELPTNVTNASEQHTALPPQASASQPLILPRQPAQEDALQSQFFYFEDDQPDPGVPFVAPFQISNAMPTAFAQAQLSNGVPAMQPPPETPPARRVRKRRLSLPLLAIFVCVAVIIGLVAMNALAQTAPRLQARGTGSPPIVQPTKNQPKPTGKPSPTSSPVPTNGANGQGQGQPSTDWVPQQFPPGWINAGLQPSDGLQAFRTAVTFNDREMSLDYRSVGTRQNHGGSFTAATFVLTTAARQRFLHNDVREINNTLFDMVATSRLIRLVINPQPQLVAFAELHQQQFAWVDVTFQLWQSRIDPQNPTRRIEGIDLDPTTKQPRLYHMMVLLLRVPPQNAGANPAMGGTGWLVSTYGLDLPNGTPLDIVQPA